MVTLSCNLREVDSNSLAWGGLSSFTLGGFVTSRRAVFQNFVIELPETRSKQRKLKNGRVSFYEHTRGTSLR